MSNTFIISQALHCVTQAIAANNATALARKDGSETINNFLIFDVSWDKKSENHLAEKYQLSFYESYHKLLKQSKRKRIPLSKNEPSNLDHAALEGLSTVIEKLNFLATNAPMTFQAMLANDESNQAIIHLFVLDITHQERGTFRSYKTLTDTFLNHQNETLKITLDFLANYFSASPSSYVAGVPHPLIISANLPLLFSQILSKITINPVSALTTKLSQICHHDNQREKFSNISNVIDELSVMVNAPGNNSFIAKNFMGLILSSLILAHIENCVLSLSERQILSAKCLSNFHANIATNSLSTTSMHLTSYHQLWTIAKQQFDAFNMFHQTHTAYQQIIHEVAERHLQQFTKYAIPGEYTAELIHELSFSIGTLIVRVEHARTHNKPWPFDYLSEKNFWLTCCYPLISAPFNTPNLIHRCSQLMQPIILGLIKHNQYAPAKAFSSFILEFSNTPSISASVHDSFNKHAYSTLCLLLHAFEQAGLINSFKDKDIENIITRSKKDELPLHKVFIDHMTNALFLTLTADLTSDSLENSQLLTFQVISILGCGEKENPNNFHKELNEVKKHIVAYKQLLNALEEFSTSNGIKDLLTKLENNPLFITKLKKNAPSQMNLLKDLLNINVYSYITPLRQAIIERLIQYADNAFETDENMAFDAHEALTKLLTFVKPILSHMQLSEVEDKSLSKAFKLQQLDEKRDEITIALLDSIGNDEPLPTKSAATKKKKNKSKKASSNKTSVKQASNLSTPLANAPLLEDITNKTPAETNAKNDDTQHSSNKRKKSKKKTENNDDAALPLADKTSQTLAEEKDKIDNTETPIAHSDKNKIIKTDLTDWQVVIPASKKVTAPQKKATQPLAAHKPRAYSDPQNKKITTKEKKPQNCTAGESIRTRNKPTLTIDTTITNKGSQPASFLDLERIGLKKLKKYTSDHSITATVTTAPQKNITEQSCATLKTGPWAAREETRLKNEDNALNQRSESKPVITPTSLSNDTSNAHTTPTASDQKPEPLLAKSTWGERAKKKSIASMDTTMPLARQTEALIDVLQRPTPLVIDSPKSQTSEQSQLSQLSANSKAFTPSTEAETKPRRRQRRLFFNAATTNTFNELTNEKPEQSPQAVYGRVISGFPKSRLPKEFHVINLINTAIIREKGGSFPLSLSGKALSVLHTGRGTINDFDCSVFNIPLEEVLEIVNRCCQQENLHVIKCKLVGVEHPIILLEVLYEGHHVKVDLSSLNPSSLHQTFYQALYEKARRKDIACTIYDMPLVETIEGFYPIIDPLNFGFYYDEQGNSKTFLDNEVIEINPALTWLVQATTMHDATQTPYPPDAFTDDPLRMLRLMKEMIEAPAKPFGPHLSAQLPIIQKDNYQFHLWWQFLFASPNAALHQNQFNTKMSYLFSICPGNDTLLPLNKFNVLNGIILAAVSANDFSRGVKQLPEDFTQMAFDIKKIIVDQNTLSQKFPFQALMQLIQNHVQASHTNETHPPIHSPH